MSKRIGVLFSSGLDSTYLVYKNLKEGNIVSPIYIEIENNQHKSIIEKNRIELLYNEFSEEFNGNEFYDRKIKPIKYVMKTNVGASEDSIHLKQVPVWIIGLLFSQGLDVDEIQIGYVCGDDSTSYIEDMKEIYYSYERISEKLKPISFPLIKQKKWQIIRELPEKYHKYIYSCESPNLIGKESDEFVEYEACCSCVACKTIIISNYYETGNFPKEYTNGLIRHYHYQIEKLGYKMVCNQTNEVYNPWDNPTPKIPKEGVQLKFDFDNEDELRGYVRNRIQKKTTSIDKKKLDIIDDLIDEELDAKARPKC